MFGVFFLFAKYQNSIPSCIFWWVVVVVVVVIFVTGVKQSQLLDFKSWFRYKVR